MTQKELEQKVIDAEGRVAKREAVLKKHNSQLAKMIEKGADRFDISIKREDIKSATSKLAEARETLANWQDKLNTRITRDAYLEANTPEILKDFLENWKQHAIGYYREKRIRFIEYRDDLKAKERAARLEALQTLPSLEKYRELYKGRELTDYDLANLWPRRDVDAFLSERGLEYQNKTYRWSGTTYAVIGNDLAIGETASTAYRGDRGKTAYDHSQSAHAPADAEKNVQSDWNETDGNSDAFIKNKPAIPKAVTKTVQTLSDAASKSFTVTGYILSVILIDSVTKEQVIGDVSFENATASANGEVTVTLAAAPSNPILVIITSIAL